MALTIASCLDALFPWGSHFVWNDSQAETHPVPLRHIRKRTVMASSDSLTPSMTGVLYVEQPSHEAHSKAHDGFA